MCVKFAILTVFKRADQRQSRPHAAVTATAISGMCCSRCTLRSPGPPRRRASHARAESVWLSVLLCPFRFVLSFCLLDRTFSLLLSPFSACHNYFGGSFGCSVYLLNLESSDVMLPKPRATTDLLRVHGAGFSRLSQRSLTDGLFLFVISSKMGHMTSVCLIL